MAEEPDGAVDEVGTQIGADGERRVTPVPPTPAQVAATLADFDRPDAALRDAWQQEDRCAAAARDAAPSASASSDGDGDSDKPMGSSG